MGVETGVARVGFQDLESKLGGEIGVFELISQSLIEWCQLFLFFTPNIFDQLLEARCLSDHRFSLQNPIWRG